MGAAVSCPKCRGQTHLANPGIVMLVCSYCSSIVYREGAALRLGAESILPPGGTLLALHQTGSLDGQPFQVVGHVRYEHDRGHWDEWYLQLDGLEVAWLSEDERELVREEAIEADGPLPGADELEVGLSIALGGGDYRVREVGRALCAGGEGQLPFAVEPGETYVYAELVTADGENLATLEYDAGGRPTCFAGTPLSRSALQLDDAAPAPATAIGGATIECDDCGASLEVPGDREVTTRVCEYCGVQLDLSATEARVLGRNPDGYEPGFSFAIGEAASFDGGRYEVAGRLVYTEPGGYTSREYLLFSPDAGYLWLLEEDGHYLLARPSNRSSPEIPPGARPHAQVEVGDESYRLYERGRATLRYIDGALPWRARSGDEFEYVDLMAPPKLFSVELDGEEADSFEGEYVEPGEVWRRFSREGEPPARIGVHAAQPFPNPRWLRWLLAVGASLLVANFVLLVMSRDADGRQVLSREFAAKDYLAEATTEPFSLSGEAIIGVTLAAPVNNSWLYMDLALVDERDQVVAEMGGEVSFYHGIENGERWTEGRRRETYYFRSPPAGTYRLILRGEAGKDSGLRKPAPEPLRVSITEGAELSRYYAVSALATLVIMTLALIHRQRFERRRWSEVEED